MWSGNTGVIYNLCDICSLSGMVFISTNQLTVPRNRQTSPSHLGMKKKSCLESLSDNTNFRIAQYYSVLTTDINSPLTNQNPQTLDNC